MVEEATDAGVWVFGGGLESRRATSRPPTGRSPTARGFAIVDVSSHEEALEWAAKIALACRCAQEVRELLPDDRLIDAHPRLPQQPGVRPSK